MKSDAGITSAAPIHIPLNATPMYFIKLAISQNYLFEFNFQFL
jgi:hypothetical protein